MRIVNLELDHYNFYCPVTGSKIFGDGFFKSSAATGFVYIQSAGAFEVIPKELKEVYQQIIEDDEDLDNEEIFCKKINDNKIVMFEITTSGIACGPVCETVYLAINMNYTED